VTEFNGICYPRNFLTEVIARVDLVNPIEELKQILSEPVNQAALGTFPLREPRKAVAAELQFGPKDVKSSRSEFTQWIFHGRRREKRLVIGHSSIYVSYKQYETYEQLRGEFLNQAVKFFDSYPEAEPSRLGLRYINHIDFSNGDPINWSGLVNPKMLSIFEVVEGKPKISRALHNLELAEDDFQLRFQFGMNNPDYPAPIKRKVFVLDLDAYRRGYFQPAELSGLLDRFHHRIQELFEMSITDRVRGVLNDAEGP
jgi:uncharacterized protein (TIGR04255 family)